MYNIKIVSFGFDRLLTVILIGVATVILGSSASSQSPSPSFADKIIGTWEGRLETPTIKMKIRDTYSPGGYFNQAGFIIMNGERRALAVSGTWEIKGNRLKTTAQSSNLPDIVPNGSSQTDKILRINANEMEIEQPVAGSTCSLRCVWKRVK